MLSHIARPRPTPILGRPLAGLAVVLALLVAWLGQSTIVGTHRHDETHSAPHACDVADHGHRTPAPPHDPTDPHNHPKSDADCQICVLASLTASSSAPPIEKPLMLPTAPGRIVILSITHAPPSVETPGVPLGRGPPLV